MIANHIKLNAGEGGDSSIMSEESFVILGSSPLASMCPDFEQLQEARLEVDGHDSNNLMTNSSSVNCKQTETIGTDVRQSVFLSSKTSSIEMPKTQNELSMNDSIKSSNKFTTVPNNGSNSSSMTSGPHSSLAASFLLGEVEADVLKTSVYSQFPSLCSMEACAEDVIKLQTIMTEYVQLKNTLMRFNYTIKQYYEKTQERKHTQEQLELKLQDCQNQIASLRNENLELKREVNEKMNELSIYEDLRKKEYAGLSQSLSEKTAVIANMSKQIEHLEQQQLASFEYVPKNENDSKQKPDYVDRAEHQRVVKDLQRELSVLVAENLDFKDMKTKYIDELNCLKVNCTAAEELLSQHKFDIALLKTQDMKKTETFGEYEKERDSLRSEVSMLRQQVEVYSKDFEMERISRQNIAGERDGLLQDLRALQRKNQELIEAAAKAAGVQVNNPFSTSNTSSMFSTVPPQQRPVRGLPSSSTGANSANRADLHRCPICSKVFTSLSVLQGHVNDCLDKCN